MKISIITVNRNNREGLLKTILSVESQTARPYEFIIIDGASTDGSAELLNQYASIISYFVSEPDAGIYQAMNKGVRNAHGEYCIFMKSGDRFCSDVVLKKLEASGAESDIICGDTIILENPPRRKTAPASVTLDYLYSGSLCHQSALIKTELLRQHPYDESLRIVADRKFFLQTIVLDRCSYRHVDVDIADYDIEGYSAKNRFASEQEWQQVLSDMIPERILLDYGRKDAGPLYGTSAYERMFVEIGRRRWRNPVYRLVRSVLSIVGVFVPSARFVRLFPKNKS